MTYKITSPFFQAPLYLKFKLYPITSFYIVFSFKVKQKLGVKMQKLAGQA